MNKSVQGFTSPLSGLRITLLCFVACSMVATAADKDYPVAGNVVALGTYQQTIGNGGPPALHRTYTVKTPDRVYVLVCAFWMNGIHIHSPSECGGKKKIALGDVLHFRIEKNRAFIPTDEGKEQKLEVLSEGINEDAAGQSPKP